MSSRKSAGAPGSGVQEGVSSRSWSATARVIFDAVLRPERSLASVFCPASPLRGAGDAGEELRVVFLGCRTVAAPAILFRVKREGFSGCRAEAVPEGILLTCRR